MSGDKKDNIFYITHSGELLIWLVIVLIIVAVSTITYVSNSQKDNDYNIFMNDVVESFGKYIGDLTENNPVKARKRLLSFTATIK